MKIMLTFRTNCLLLLWSLQPFADFLDSSDDMASQTTMLYLNETHLKTKWRNCHPCRVVCRVLVTARNFEIYHGYRIFQSPSVNGHFQQKKIDFLNFLNSNAQCIVKCGSTSQHARRQRSTKLVALL